MNIFSVLILCLTAFFTFQKSSFGIAIFLAARVLIPEVVRLPIESLSLNSGIILVVFGIYILKLFQNGGKLHVNTAYIRCLFVFVTCSAIILPFSNFMDLQDQYMKLVEFFLANVLPAILAICIIKTDDDLKIIITAFLVVICISMTYGLISFIMQDNPYVIFFQKFYSYAYYADSTLYDWRGYRPSATFISGNTYGYFLTMTIPLCAFWVSKKKYGILSKAALILLLVNLLACKRRSAMIAIAFFFIFWYISGNPSKRIKQTLFALIPCIALVFVIFITPSLVSIKNMLITTLIFWDDNAISGMAGTGSSIALRIRQATYPFTEIKDNLLFGHGFGWCECYIEAFKLHPQLYGFESILATGICEFGLIAFILYPMLFYKSYRYSVGNRRIKLLSAKTNYQFLFMITEIILVIATGFNYYWLFFIIIILMERETHFETRAVL